MLSGFSDLLKKIDPEFHDASHELLDELGVKPEDIDPVILVSKSTMKSSCSAGDEPPDFPVIESKRSARGATG